MRKKMATIISSVILCSGIYTIPAHAELEDVNSAFQDINGNGGAIQISEFSPYDDCKMLRIIETVNVDSSNSNFVFDVTDKLKEISKEAWFDYNYVYLDRYFNGDPHITSSSIYNFSEDREDAVFWGDSGIMSVYSISQEKMLKVGTPLKDFIESGS